MTATSFESEGKYLLTKVSAATTTTNTVKITVNTVNFCIGIFKVTQIYIFGKESARDRLCDRSFGEVVVLGWISWRVLREFYKNHGYYACRIF
jgi:hypothetical protein